MIMRIIVYRASLFYSNEYCAETTIDDELIGEMAPASHHSSPTAFQIIKFLLEFGWGKKKIKPAKPVKKIKCKNLN